MNQPSHDDLILDFHLHRLGETELAKVEELLRTDAAFRQKSEQLGAVLRPLDAFAVQPAPANLADKVVAYVEAQRRPVRYGRFLRPFRGRSGERLVAVRDLLAAAACIVLMAGLMVPSISSVRSRSQKAACAGRMKSVYGSLSIYQEVFSGSLPFAWDEPQASWLPEGRSSAPYASNSRHVYRLLKDGFGPMAKDFVCPADREGLAMDVADYAAYGDFIEARNITYDTLNLSGPSGSAYAGPDVVFLADRNPLFHNGAFVPSVDPKSNSSSHGGKGQMILRVSGTADFVESPIVGTGQDNIWLAGNTRYYTGLETRTDPSDSFLIPSFPERVPPKRRTK